jgi:peptidylprolyl isomerase
MSKADKGNKVKVHYRGKVKNGGQFFDTREQKEPLEFEVGSGQLLTGFDNAVRGMSPGETIEVEIMVDEAYGPYREDLVQKIDRSQVPEEYHPSLGDILQSEAEDGVPMQARVVEVDDETITLDSNHPLAGKDLVFEIELVEIIG